MRRGCAERRGAVKGAPLLGAAERTLDGEDRSEMIAEEGKAGRKVGEKWSAKMVPSGVLRAQPAGDPRCPKHTITGNREPDGKASRERWCQTGEKGREAEVSWGH